MRVAWIQFKSTKVPKKYVSLKFTMSTFASTLPCISFSLVNNNFSICFSEVGIRKLFPKSVVMCEYIYLTWNYASRADTQVSQQQNTYSVNLLLTLFFYFPWNYARFLLNKRKSQKKCLDSRVILLKTVQEALDQGENNQTKQNILGCSFTSLKDTTGNLSAFSG